jgi:hypothetical protein
MQMGTTPQENTRSAEEASIRREVEKQRVRDAAPQLMAALQVIVLTPAIVAWLESNDPKALEQARRAIASASGEITYPLPGDAPATVLVLR